MSITLSCDSLLTRTMLSYTVYCLANVADAGQAPDQHQVKTRVFDMHITAH